MLKRLGVFGGALFGSAVLLGVGGATRLGIPVEAWPYVWPAIVAFCMLLLAIVALVLGWRKLSLPLWAAFIAQTIGAVVLLFDKIESPWDTILWTAVTVGVVLVVGGIAWLGIFLRARWLEKRLVEGFGDTKGADPEAIDEIRENMTDALETLKRAGHGRNAVYELPWFLVMGRPSAGKTEAIKRSGLRLPVKKDWVKGVGGTHTSQFFFTNEMIFLDTPGKWVQEGATPELKKYWGTLTKLLRKNRGRRPLDGLIIVVPADDLLKLDRRDLADEAANIREIVDLLQDELRFRFPVYLLVSKSDLVSGFVDYFWGIPIQRRDEILGWSNEDPNDTSVGRLIDQGFAKMRRRLHDYGLEVLSKSARRSRNRRLFFFDEEFEGAREPLKEFAEQLLHEDPSTQTPVFRGFYFTSAMPGEGAPISRAMEDLGRHLNLSLGSSDSTPEEEEAVADKETRSFFLLELLRELMVGDDGLVARSRFHWLKQRRKTAFGTFLPAGLAVLFVVLSAISLIWNRSVYNGIAAKVPAIVAELDAEAGKPLDHESLSKRLEQTEKLRRFHRKMTAINPLRGFGMRRAKALTGEVYDVYRFQLGRAVLQPTLEQAQQLVAGDAPFCSDRVEILHSVGWLRTAGRFESSVEIDGLVRWAWDAGISEDQRNELSKSLRRQYSYLVRHAPDGAGDSFLPGFDLDRAANDLVTGCASLGQESSLSLFAEFQKDCLKQTYDWELLSYCNDTLQRIVEWNEQKGNLYSKRLADLKAYLKKSDERGAQTALSTLDAIEILPASAMPCVERFDAEVLPGVKEYIPGATTVGECRTQRREGGSYREFANVWFDEQAKTREQLEHQIKGFNLDESCSGVLRTNFDLAELDFSAVETFGYQYLRDACQRDRDQIQTAAAPADPGAPPPVKPAVQPVRKPVSKPQGGRSRSKLFGTTCNPADTLTSAGWDYRKRGWNEKWLDAETGARLTSTQRDNLRAEVRRAVDAFGRNFREDWLKCLARVRWHEDSRTNDVAAWLKTISQSPELGTLLRRPADEANAIVGAASEEPFNSVVPSMTTAAQLFAPLADAASTYQQLLGAVAADLERVQGDDAEFLAFQRAFQSGDAGNSLVGLQLWLQQNGGMANGRLRALFEKPAGLAATVVGSQNVGEALWSRIREEWDAQLGERYPFVPDPSAEVADEEMLRAVFGGESGMVNTLPEGVELGPNAKRWLDRARELSQALFDGDELRPLRIAITSPEAPDFSEMPEKGQKKYKLTSVTLDFGAGTTFEWAEDVGVKDQLLDIDLFGLASDQAKVEATVAERKGILRRQLGKDWREGEVVPVLDVQGHWAPLRLLVQGIEGGVGGDRVPVSYRVPWSWGDKDDQNGTYVVQYSLRVERLEPLVQLVRNGMSGPPGLAE